MKSYVVLPLLGLLTLWLPTLFLAGEDKMSGETLAAAHPEHAWLRWGFARLMAGFTLILAGGLYMFSRRPDVTSAHLLLALAGSLCGLAGVQGTITLRTRICPIPLIYRTYFATGPKARNVGRLQSMMSIVLLIVVMTRLF